MVNPLVHRHYELADEASRLWRTPVGELTRLRTWDIFDRFLPGFRRVADVGGGPGTHAARLASQGYDVVLVDPIPRHVQRASTFSVMLGDARQLPLASDCSDAVLMLGPLYHLADPAERLVALQEAWRVLRPGGRLLAEVITRHAWLIDASAKGLLGEPGIWETFEINLRSGLSNEPDRIADGSFWAYFHAVEELGPEVQAAGFEVAAVVAVEGFAATLGNLAELLREPADLLRALRLSEAEPSILGVSPHVIAAATKPG